MVPFPFHLPPQPRVPGNCSRFACGHHSSAVRGRAPPFTYGKSRGLGELPRQTFTSKSRSGAHLAL